MVTVQKGQADGERTVTRKESHERKVVWVWGLGYEIGDGEVAKEELWVLGREVGERGIVR